MGNGNLIQYVYKSRPNIGGLMYAWFQAMFTRVDLLIYGSLGENCMKQIIEIIYREVLRLEGLGNYYDADSELARLNRSAFRAPQIVSRELYDILAFCIDSYDKTGGCFDVTIQSEGYKPGNIEYIKLFPDRYAVGFMQPGISIDLSGLLKGYALDKIRDILLCHGIVNALVNMGNSSILALGHAPFAEAWSVGFNNDFPSFQQKVKSLLLRDECLTTSGNSSAGRKHIISPFTGQFIKGKKGVAVITLSGAVGEVLSTALFVADAEQRKRIVGDYSPRFVMDS